MKGENKKKGTRKVKEARRKMNEARRRKMNEIRRRKMNEIRRKRSGPNEQEQLYRDEKKKKLQNT